MKITCAHGTAKQFEEAVRNRISELGGEVDEINSATDANDNERYIHTLIGDIDNELTDIVDSVTFDTDENNLIVTTAVDENVHEYSIPLKDLTMDFKSMDKDVNYVCNYIKRDINACSNIEGAEDFDDTDEYEDFQTFDYHTLIPAVTEKLKSVGVDVDSPEADDYIDEQAFLIGESDEKDVEYWWQETQSDPMFMDVIDELPHVEDEGDKDSTCDRCGRPLNEMGTCPVCDEGEEDYD